MTHGEALAFLERLRALLPAYAPDMADPAIAADVEKHWWNSALVSVDAIEADLVAAELTRRWNLPRWPRPGDFNDVRRRLRGRAAKDAAIAAARAAINAAPPSVFTRPEARRP